MSLTDNTQAQRRTELALRRAALSARAQQVLEQRLHGTESSRAQVIPRRSPEDTAPLSFAQERLWFIDQFEPKNVAYNICVPLRITGRLNAAALEQSIFEVVRRHESLRTRFVAVDGKPVQIIAPHRNLCLPIVDVAMAPDFASEGLTHLISEASERPFDLEKGPLLRAALLRLGQEDHVLLLLLHHIIFDEWSMQVLIRDAAQIYRAFDLGEPSTLAELPIQYKDFAHWQREWLQGAVLERELSYWRRQLHDSPPLLDLPTDRPRKAVMNAREMTEPLVIPEEVAKKLIILTQETGTTLFMTLLASFQILLSRCTGQMDIPVGTPVAGRRWVETEGMIGFFVNTLVMRTRLASDLTIREVLSRVREVALEAQAHQDLPLEKLVEDLQPARSLSHGPLFQVMFSFENAPRNVAAALPGMTVSLVRSGNARSKFDLSLGLAQSEGKIYGSFEYNTDLFETLTIERMVGHYQNILVAMVADPDQRLSEIELLSSPERRQLLEEWNDTEARNRSELCVPELFERQVHRSPEAPALVSGERQFSYGELNRRANQLAHYLRGAGVGPEDLVAICVERSVEMIVALLAVLKSGAAYVGLDPAYPSEVLRFILEDSQACLVLSRESLRGTLSQLSIPIFEIDPGRECLASQPHTNLNGKVSASNLACLIYTSGSTGTPKGVMIEHGALADYTQTATQIYELKATDRVLQFSSICFDPHIEDIYPCLTQGGTVVLRNDEMLSSASDFLTSCREQGVTVLTVPTAYWHVLTADMSAPAWEETGALRLIILGGESVLPERVRAFVASIGGRVRLTNTYGPTETTVIVTMGELDREHPLEAVGIGRALANTELYVLDEILRPVPLGVAGELLIGGKGLARGYLQRPELTAERFIPHPLSTRAGARLYRTGDLVRYLGNGNLQYLGRKDHQVKVRGFRIEIGEIEAVLDRHEGVKAAAVVAREERPGETQLVAYVVAETRRDGVVAESGAEHANGQKTSLDTRELRRYLRERLPEHMVPAVWVWLDTLPLTASGKVDRRVLPAPNPDNSELGLTYVAPRTPIEDAMAVIWAAVLGVARVGVEDNFFEIGGHSLLATQVISRIREAFAVAIPMRTLFERPTISALAENIETILWITQHVTASVDQAGQDYEGGEV